MYYEGLVMLGGMDRDTSEENMYCIRSLRLYWV